MSESFFSKFKNLPFNSDSNIKILQKTELSSYINSQANNFSVHLCFFELPDKLGINILSDSMINPNPDSKALANICKIAAKIFYLLENKIPKVALLSANEKISPKVFSTQLCADSSKILSDKDNIIAEGPVSFDLAISSISAQIKKYKGKIQGDADILITPNIDAGSGLLQSLKYIIKVPTAEIIYSDNNNIAAIVEENNDIAVKIAQYIERKLNSNV